MNQTIKCTFLAVKCTFLIVCWLDWGIQTSPYPGLGEDCSPPHIWLAFVVTPCWDFCKHPSIKSRYSARKLGKFIRQTVAFVLKLPQNQEADVFWPKNMSESEISTYSPWFLLWPEMSKRPTCSWDHWRTLPHSRIRASAQWLFAPAKWRFIGQFQREDRTSIWKCLPGFPMIVHVLLCSIPSAPSSMFP